MATSNFPRCGRRLGDEELMCQLPVHHDGPCMPFGPSSITVTDVVPGGAKRDPHPERPPANFFSVDLESVEAIAMTHYEGDNRYGMDNWQRGLPASNLANHAWYHLLMLNSGDTSEPHLEHAIWNLGKIRWMAKHRPEMIDVPAYRRYFGLSTDKSIPCPECVREHRIGHGINTPFPGCPTCKGTGTIVTTLTPGQQPG